MWTGTHNDYTSKATQIHITFLTFSLPIFNYLISLKTFSIFALSAKNNNIKILLLMKPFFRRPVLRSRDVFFSERVSKALKA